MPTSFLGRSLWILAALFILAEPIAAAAQPTPQGRRGAPARKPAGQPPKAPSEGGTADQAAAAKPPKKKQQNPQEAEKEQAAKEEAPPKKPLPRPVIERIVLLDCSTSMLSGTEPDAPLNRWEEASRDIRNQVRTWQEEHPDWPISVVPFELEAFPALVTSEEHLVAQIADHRPANRGGRAHLYKALQAVRERIASSEADLYQIWVYSDGTHTALAQEGGPTATELATSFCETLGLVERGRLIIDWIWPSQHGGSDLASFFERVRRCLKDDRTWSVRSGKVPAVVFLPPDPVLFALPDEHPSKVDSRPVRWSVWVDPTLRDTDLGFLWETSEIAETRADFGFVPNEFSLRADGRDITVLEGRFELGNFWDMRRQTPYRFTTKASLVDAPRDLAIRFVGSNPVEGQVELLPAAQLEVLGPEDRTDAPIDVGKSEVHVPIVLSWNSGARGGRLSWSTPLLDSLDVSLWTRPKEGPPERWTPPEKLKGAGEVELNLVLRRKPPEPPQTEETDPAKQAEGQPGEKPEEKPAEESAVQDAEPVAAETPSDEAAREEPPQGPELLFEESVPIVFTLTGLEEPIERSLTLVVDPPPRVTVTLDEETAPEGVISRFFFGQTVTFENAIRIEPANRRARGLPIEVRVEKPDGIPLFEILDIDERDVLRRGIRLRENVGEPTLLALRLETSRLPAEGGDVKISFRCGKEPELLWSDEITLRLIPTGPRVWVPQPLASRTQLPYRSLSTPIRTQVALKWNRAAEGKDVSITMRPTPGLRVKMKLGDEVLGDRLILGDEHQALLTLEMTPEQYGEHRLNLGMEGFGNRRDLEFVLTRPNAELLAKFTEPSLDSPPLIRVSEPHSYLQIKLEPANPQSAGATIMFDRNLRPGLAVRFRVDGELLDPPVVQFSAEKPKVTVDVEIEATFDFWTRFGYPDRSSPEPTVPPRANSISIRPSSAADSVNRRPEIVIPIVFRMARPGIELSYDGELPEHLDLGRVELPGTGYWGWLIGGGTRQATGPPMLLRGKDIAPGLAKSLQGPLLTLSIGPEKVFKAARLISSKKDGRSFVQIQVDIAESIEPALFSTMELEGHVRFSGPEGLDTPEEMVTVWIEVAPTLSFWQVVLLVVVLGGLIAYGIRKLRSRNVRTTDDRLWAQLDPPRHAEPRSGSSTSNPNRPMSDG
ncbi:MAG: hypothetical protein RL885_28955 [Planctomycetota bacterium]